MSKNVLAGQRTTKVRLKNAHRLSAGSQRWLTRQLNDPYVQKAQALGLRSRAAFKLMQLDDKFGFFKKGKRVVDLGAAPGGWSQIAVQRVDPHRQGGYVLGIDLLPIDPLEGALFLKGDFWDAVAQSALLSAVGSAPVDIVLSDMAASTTGYSQVDHLRTISLAEGAFAFSKNILAPGGTFVAKVFQGGADHDLLQYLKKSFAQIKHMKPPASRKKSPEMYVVAFGFKK